MRAIPKSVALLLAFGAAALAGVTVGAMTASPSPTPVPTIPVAAIPTSTPDLRSPAPTQTLTPTQRPASPVVTLVPAPTATAPTVPVTARPTPTPEPRGRPVVFLAAPGRPPAAVTIIGTSSGPESDRVYFRLRLLRETTATGPDGYLNPFGTTKARLTDVTVADPRVVTVGFLVPEGDWGVTALQAPLLVQQIVFTATEEANIDRVVLTQNGGKPAVINGITYDKALGREDVR